MVAIPGRWVQGQEEKREERNVSEDLPESGSNAIKEKEKQQTLQNDVLFVIFLHVFLAVTEGTTDSPGTSDCIDLSKRNFVCSVAFILQFLLFFFW